MLGLMGDFAWDSLSTGEGVSSDNNSDASLLEEIERLYRMDDQDIHDDDHHNERGQDRRQPGGGDGDEGGGAAEERDDANEQPGSSGEEGPRQKRLRKHRESMARLRQDRRDRIKVLDKQEKTLEHKLHRALRWMAVHRADHEANGCRRLAYADLVEATESLLVHKYALEEELHRRHRFAKLLVGEIPRLSEESDVVTRAASSAVIQPAHTQPRQSVEASGTGEKETTQGCWMRYLDDESPFYYDPESPEACAAAIELGLKALASARRRIVHGDSPVLTAHCLGWKVESVVVQLHTDTEVPVLHFRFTRRVARLWTSLDELQDRTWAIHQSPDDMARMYGATVVAKYVQKVSEDAFIVLRNLPGREDVRFFSLTSRMRALDGDSSAIVMAVLGKQPRQAELESGHCRDTTECVDGDGDGDYGDDQDDDAVEWLRFGVASLQFSHNVSSDDAIEIEYMGTIECVGHSHAAHLVIESCATLMRWEHLVVPPRLLN